MALASCVVARPVEDRVPRMYRICGVTVRSNLPLPADTVSVDVPDIDVEYMSSSIPASAPRLSLKASVTSTPRGMTVEYMGPDGGISRYEISQGGRRIDMKTSYEPVAGLWYVLLGLPLAVSLFLRGTAALHASAVVVDHSAVVIAGPSGAGKSTTTAAMLAAGAAMLSDDLCALSNKDGRTCVDPGYPILRMSQDTGRLLGRSGGEMFRIFENAVPDDKRWVDARDLPGGFHADAAPLSALYLLTGRRHVGVQPMIEPIPPPRACVSLERHGYAWNRLDPSSCITLPWRAGLAANVPAFRLTLPDGLERLPAAAEAVMRHAASLAAFGRS